MWRIWIGVLTATACLSGLVVSAATEPVSKVTRSSIVERLQPQAVPFDALPASRSIGGKRCLKRGVERVSKGVTFVCRKKGKALTWVKKPKPTSLPVTSPEPLYEPPTSIGAAVQTCRLAEDSWQRRQYSDQASGFPALEKYVPHQSTVRMALIPIDWSDAPGDPTFTQSILTQTQKLTDWYDYVSEGRLKVEWVVNPNWIRLPGSVNSYAVPYSGDNQATANFFNQVIPAVDSAFDFRGIQVANFLLPQGQSVVRESVQEWPWNQIPALSTNEGRLTSATAAGAFFERAPREYWSYWAHEFGHVLQLAHIGSSRQWSSMTGYDIMGSQDGPTRELSGWMRFLAGWLSDDQVHCQEKSNLQPTKIMLNPLTQLTPGVKAAIIRVSPTEAIIIESRRPNKWSCSTVNNTAYLTSGVLVYTYDATKGTQEEFLEAVRPDGRAIVSTSCPSSPEPNSLLQSGESVTVKGVTISVLSGGSSNRYDTVNVSTS